MALDVMLDGSGQAEMFMAHRNNRKELENHHQLISFERTKRDRPETDLYHADC